MSHSDQRPKTPTGPLEAVVRWHVDPEDFAQYQIVLSAPWPRPARYFETRDADGNVVGIDCEHPSCFMLYPL